MQIPCNKQLTIIYNAQYIKIKESFLPFLLTKMIDLLRFRKSRNGGPTLFDQAVAIRSGSRFCTLQLEFDKQDFDPDIVMAGNVVKYL